MNRSSTAFPETYVTVEDMIAEGDKVVVRLSMSATQHGAFMGLPPTGKHVTFTGIDIKHPITRSAVARRAGVSVVFLRSHPDLLQAIEEAEQRRRLTPSESGSDKAKDQVVAALRRRLDEMKQQLAAKDQQLRGKQREIDRLYGKLAAASPITDTELRSVLAEALDRLAWQER